MKKINFFTYIFLKFKHRSFFISSIGPVSNTFTYQFFVCKKDFGYTLLLKVNRRFCCSSYFRDDFSSLFDCMDQLNHILLFLQHFYCSLVDSDYFIPSFQLLQDFDLTRYKNKNL